MTATELLNEWDAGQSVWSIEMGGLGPGYEQAIQVLAIEIVRDNQHTPLPEKGKAFDDWGDSTVFRIDHRDPVTGKYSMGGFSGAQVGVAKYLAYKWLTGEMEAALDKPELQDRKIQVSKFFPQVAA